MQHGTKQIVVVVVVVESRPPPRFPLPDRSRCRACVCPPQPGGRCRGGGGGEAAGPGGRRPAGSSGWGRRAETRQVRCGDRGGEWGWVPALVPVPASAVVPSPGSGWEEG